LAVAGAVADFPGVQWVRYPYLSSHPQFALAQAQMCMGGGVFTFEVAGGAAGAMRVVDRVGMISRSANLGDTRTIITHPATTTHRSLTPEERAQVGISDGMLRVSVGLEDVVDILSDLEQAISGA
jgi:O-succinylhomoserine sulfhydrylase